MINRQYVHTSLRLLTSNRQYLPKTQVRTLAVPLPKSIAALREKKSRDRPVGSFKKLNQRRLDTKSKSASRSDVDTRKPRPQSIRPDEYSNQHIETQSKPEVELYLQTKLPQILGLKVTPQDHNRHRLFEYMPACMFKDNINPRAIDTLWPVMQQLLPPDPLTEDLRSHTHGLAFNSWSPYSETVTGPQHYNELQLGWILAIFASPLNPKSLLRDGTDTRFLPGPADFWPYRVWSKGSIKFCQENIPRLHFTASTFHVLEKPVAIKQAGDVVSVTIRKTVSQIYGRKLGALQNGPDMLKMIDKEPTDDLQDYSGPFVVDEYSLAFFREKPRTLADNSRVIKFAHKPVISHNLILNRHHLFCWSTVTQNAHLIHLDTEFAQTEYGAKDLVVQGPFIVFLTLEWLRRALTAMAVNKLDKFVIQSIDYRILSPIFVDEPIRFCARPMKRPEPGGISSEWQIWIEKLADNGQTTLTFQAIAKLRTQFWDGRSPVRTGSHKSEYEPREGSDPESLFNTEADPLHDDSGEFSSPFFKQ